MAANPDLTRGPVLLSLSMVSACFAFATVIIRFCVRTKISNNVGLDDYAMGIASVVALIATIFSIVESVSMGSSSTALEFDFLGQPWFWMGSAMAKISICLFFIRLVGAVKQWRILLSSQILVIAAVNFAFSLTTNLQCRPLVKLWTPSVEGECWDPSVQLNIGYFQGALSIFWWLFLSLFPVMIVRDLEMHRRMRWPFYFLSSLSLIAAIFATVRTYETSQAVRGVYTFDTFFATALSLLEQNLGIIAANVLPMGPLFSRRQRAAIRAESRAAIARPHSAGHASVLIIEGPRKGSYDSARDNSDGRSIAGSVMEGEQQWPKGIIKTVEVEVVEEDIRDVERWPPRGASRGPSRLSALSVDRDWAAVLKFGPSPPGSRGPSRQA